MEELKKNRMHEVFHLADLIHKIESLAREHNASHVRKVSVGRGVMSHISPEHFREHFLFFSQATVAEGAKLTIETSEDIHDPQAQEIILKSVELEE